MAHLNHEDDDDDDERSEVVVVVVVVLEVHSSLCSFRNPSIPRCNPPRFLHETGSLSLFFFSAERTDFLLRCCTGMVESEGTQYLPVEWRSRW